MTLQSGADRFRARQTGTTANTDELAEARAHRRVPPPAGYAPDSRGVHRGQLLYLARSGDPLAKAALTTTGAAAPGSAKAPTFTPTPSTADNYTPDDAA